MYACVSSAVERLEVIADGHALAQLLELGPREQVAQVRLADEDDLNELRLLGLEVREHPHFFERRHAQVLRLVDDEQRQPPGVALRRRETARGRAADTACSRPGRGSRPKSSMIASISSRASSIVFISRAIDVLRSSAAQHRLQQRRLAAADFAGDDDEAGVALDAVAQMAERLLVDAARVEIARDRASAKTAAREARRSVHT